MPIYIHFFYALNRQSNRAFIQSRHIVFPKHMSYACISYILDMLSRNPEEVKVEEDLITPGNYRPAKA